MNRKNLIVRPKSNTWAEELEIELTVDEFNRSISRMYTITNVPKLRSFQYRVMHRALVLNTHLNRWGMREDNLCSFCQNSKETIQHIFVNCKHTKALWMSVNKTIENRGKNCNLLENASSLIFNNFKQPLVNIVVLITKQYILSSAMSW